MWRSVAAVVVVAGGLAASGCGDNGPTLPILFVQSAGDNGSGTVTSSPAGVNCAVQRTEIAGTCSANFDEGTSVTLTALAASGSTFTGWTGACTGSTATCTVTLDQSADVTAGFRIAVPRALTVSAGAGGAGGQVTSTPAGINCVMNGTTLAGTCTTEFPDGSVVTLLAAGIGASAFQAWSGDCAGSGTTPSCPVTMSADRSVVASFAGSTSFTSFIAIANAANPGTGLLVVSIPSAVFSRAGRLAGAREPGTASAVLPAQGTLQVFGTSAQTVDLTGTYDDVAKTLAVGGSGWSLNATVTDSETGELSGSFGGPLGGGIIAGTAGGTSVARTPLCGTFTGTDQGSWNVLVQDTLVTGITISDATIQIFSLTGVLRGTDFALSAIEDPAFAASGTLAADGLSASGTWTNPSQNDSGTWTVSSTCQ
jgi:uncharacterized repeat protein (TIGR02543 family)